MAYTDGNSGNRNKKAITGGVVALIQGGLAIALVNGFAVSMFPPDPPRHLPTQIYPTTSITPMPVEPPKVDAKPLNQESRITTVEPKFPIVPDDTFTDVIIDPVLPTGGATGDPTPFVTPKATEPPARFAPKTARPRGNQAGWVTTDDYPTADIRAGHTGTVRFRVGIDASGRVTDCTVTQSSGYAGLDAATCRNVTRRARFDAASDAMGEKVAGTYDGTIRWVIPQD
jgi:protein TonB